MRKVLAWHRWAGLLACLAILAWSASGVLHPVMSRLQPQPAMRVAPTPALPASLNLRQLLETHQITTVRAIHPAVVDDSSVLRVTHANGAVVYIDPSTSARLAEGEHLHARFLARYFSGEQQAAIVSLTRVTEFNDEYPYVNRLLPVWRVTFDRPDHLRVFVDTAHSRLGTLTDGRKLLFSQTFRVLHTWSWAGEGIGRLLIMSLLLMTTASTAIAGMVMAVRLRHAKKRLADKPWRRWHRRLAIAVSVSAILFTSSGLYHLLHNANKPDVLPATQLPDIDSSQLIHWPGMEAGEQLSLHDISGQSAWRISKLASMSAEHTHHSMRPPALATVRYINTQTGQLIDEGESHHAQQLALAYHSAEPGMIRDWSAVNAFADEYGFINKRLPVMRVNFKDAINTSVYVETATGDFAAMITDPDRREVWSFAWLHKWHFLDINKNLRDALLALFAFGNALVALMGLRLFVRRY